MTRKAAREIAVRLCYAMNETNAEPEELLGNTFDEEYYATLSQEDEIYADYPNTVEIEYISRIVKGVAAHQKELLSYIEKYATGWKLDRISKTAVAIMSTTMFEVLYMPDIPDSAAINEAVELARKYSAEESCPFINGVLGTISRKMAAKA